MRPREIGEVSLSVVFLALALGVFSYHKARAFTAESTANPDDHACCHAGRKTGDKLLDSASAFNLTAGKKLKASEQDPGQEEEGNPSHTRPKQSCNHKPTASQVQCHCATDCTGNGGPSEDRRCKSFCYKDMCSCPRLPCP